MNEGPWLMSLFLFSNHNSVFSPVASLLPVQRFSLYKTNEDPILNAEIQDIDDGKVIFSLSPAGFGKKTTSRFDHQSSSDTSR
jgi:hypothetical protein